jgi:hypothetical protein
MDPLTLIVGALLALVFFVLGRVSGLRQAKLLPGSSSPPKPICGCGHGLHLHDLKTNQCHHEYKKEDGQFYKDGHLWDRFQWTRCECKKYTGPIPAEEYLAQQLLPPVEGV